MASTSTSSAVVLSPSQYCHILNQDDGTISMVCGPRRVVLRSNEQCLGEIAEAVIVEESYYGVIENPYSEEAGKCLLGEIDIRLGPCKLFLHYHERVAVKRAKVLTAEQGLIVETTRDCVVEGKECKAGDRRRVLGPCRFVPTKYERIAQNLTLQKLAHNEGIYVRNTTTGEVSMKIGACAFMLDVEEEFFVKEYSYEEAEALHLPSANTHHATCVKLERGQLLCCHNYQTNEERIIQGPASYLLGPQEGVKVLNLSAGKPKVKDQIRVAKLFVGPDFTSDIFNISTKDNASLQVHLTYKWEFLVDETTLEKVFSLHDFIGYICQSLCSAVREIAGRHNFESFHSKPVSILREALFQKHRLVNSEGVVRTVSGLLFEEASLLVSEIDVKEIKPMNQEMSNLLNESIKANMMIVCQKLEQQANLAAQKEQVQSREKIERIRQRLIEIKNLNHHLETMHRTKVEGQALEIKGKAQKDVLILKTGTSKEVELDGMRRTMELLGRPQGQMYVELLKAQKFAEVPQEWFVASSSTATLPLGD